jgi:hypothetical protein
MLANTQLGPLPLTVSDQETPAAALQLLAASSNPGLFPAQNLVFAGTDSARTLTLVPATNQTGIATITVYLSDGVQTNTQSFTVRVGLPNTPPVISTIPDQMLLEHTSSPHIPFTITDSYGRADQVQVSASFVTRAPKVFVTFGSDDPPSTPTNTSHRYVVFTPAPGFTGQVTLTFPFTDGYVTIQRSVLVTVNPVDDPPGPIYLVEPAQGQTFPPGQPLTLQAIVVDSEHDLARVEFYNRDAYLGAISNAPYSFIWTNPVAGAQPVTAVAVDAAGQRTESAPVIFYIGDQYESPAFLAIRPDGAFVDLSWEADGRNMQLQESATLTPSMMWSNVVGVVPTNANTISLLRDPENPRFYRLLQVP